MEPFPEEIRAVRLRGIAASVCAFLGIISLALLTRSPPPSPALEAALPPVVVLSFAAALAFAVGYVQRSFALWRQTEAYFAESERRRRPPRPRRQQPPKPTDPAFWMRKLSERLARLARFLELKAPEIIIEQERRLIRKAIAELSPGDALAVMRAWPHLSSHLDGKRRKAPPVDKPN